MDGRPSLGKATAFFQRMHFSDAGLRSPGLFLFFFTWQLIHYHGL